MTKENFLFGIIGLLLGCIVGFMFANSVNQNAIKNFNPAAVDPAAAVDSNAPIPPGHPDINSANPGGGGMQPQVQAAIEKAKAEPDNFEAQIKAAEVFYQIQRFDGAIDYLKQANKIKPDDYETIVNLGNTNFDSKNYAEAEKWYASALTKKADAVDVRTDYGLTFLLRDPPDYERAIAEFNRSLETDPNHVQTLQNLTVAYTKKGDAEKASATLARLESADAKNTSISKLREDIQKINLK
jgi:tetratricopeptide (TPR) repeat protein